MPTPMAITQNVLITIYNMVLFFILSFSFLFSYLHYIISKKGFQYETYIFKQSYLSKIHYTTEYFLFRFQNQNF